MRKHKSDLAILFTTIGLMILGLVVIYAIGPMRANVLNSTYGSDYGANDFFIGQLRSVVISLVAFFLAFKVIPYKDLTDEILPNYRNHYEKYSNVLRQYDNTIPVTSLE